MLAWHMGRTQIDGWVWSRVLTYPDETGTRNVDRLVLCRRDVVDQRGVADDGRERVAVDVSPPLPA